MLRAGISGFYALSKGTSLAASTRRREAGALTIQHLFLDVDRRCIWGFEREQGDFER